MSLYPLVRAEIDAACWAITGAKMAAIEAALRRMDRGDEPDPAMLARFQEERLARQDERRNPGEGRPRGGVAVLPLFGILCPRANMITEYSGGTSLESWTRQFQELVNDESVSSVVMDVFSPGGMTYGVQEAWAAIMGARGVKKVVAVVNPECGSAAYWLATAAQEIVITPSGQAGSVGVYTKHVDDSAALEKEGIKVTTIAAGENKAEMSGPLSEETHAWVLSQVNLEYQNFLHAVAKGRGRTVADVKANFGQGRMLMAGQAKAAGMVDRIATLDETIARLVGKKPAVAGRAATVVDSPVMAFDADVDPVPVPTGPEVPATDPEPEPAPEPTPEPVQAGLSLADRKRRLELARRA